MDVVILLAKGGRPFRGHDESQESAEKGLFLEIVNLLKKYDPVLQSHLDSGPKNALYTSNRAQNGLIESLHAEMMRSITQCLEGKTVSLICDETSDCGHHEQLSVVIRYFSDENNRPVEVFTALERLFTVDSSSIFSALERVLGVLKIPWTSVNSVCFDGAAAMSGHISGVQAKCKGQNNKILYVHCYAHCLNLALVDACLSRAENKILFDFFGTIQLAYNFIESSPVRHAIFERISSALGTALRTLKSLSTTRWACRAEAVKAVRNNYSALVDTVEEIMDTTQHPETRAKAKGLRAQLASFEFLFCMEIAHPVLQMVLKVSCSLQDPKINLLTAFREVKNLQQALKDMRLDGSAFTTAFRNATEICQTCGIGIPDVRQRKAPRRIDMNNSSQFFHATKEEELRVNVFYPMIDAFVEGIEARFAQETVVLISAITNILRLTATDKEIEDVADYCDVESDSLRAELRLLKSQVSTQHAKLGDCNEWLDWLKENGLGTSVYKSFYKVLKSFSVIPVTSCSCERTFSKLAIVKTKLRSTMSHDRLRWLLLPFVEQNIALSTSCESVLRHFASNSRRLLL